MQLTISRALATLVFTHIEMSKRDVRCAIVDYLQSDDCEIDVDDNPSQLANNELVKAVRRAVLAQHSQPERR